MPANLENSAVATGLEKVSFHSDPKERQCQRMFKLSHNFTHLSSVQLLSRVWLFVTPWIAACQASLSIINSRSSHKLRSIESVMPSSHLILCHPLSSCPQSLPASESFPMSQLFTWGGQSTGVSALPSVLPKNTQDWSPLEWTAWISLQSKELSRVFSTPQFKSINSSALSFLHSPNLTSIHDSHASKVMVKTLQARLQQYMNRQLPDVQVGFRKGRGTNQG